MEDLFDQLAQEWRAETAPLSDLSKKVAHPSYQRIIDMGEDALPFILQDLESNPTHWFHALHAITGATPVKTKHRRRIKLMSKDWLEWSKKDMEP